MVPLIVSLLMLAVAPVFYWFSQSFRRTWKFTNRLLVLLVASIVVLHLLPESIKIIGFRASLLAMGGLFLPSILERLWKREAPFIHRLTLLLAVTGLALHGMMDGAALVAPGAQSRAMQWAVLLHRLPAAILIWEVFLPTRGRGFASGVLVILALFTCLGYYFGVTLIHSLVPGGGLHYFQALVAGSLLHVAFDQHGDQHEHAHDHHHSAG